MFNKAFKLLVKILIDYSLFNVKIILKCGEVKRAIILASCTGKSV